MIQQIVNDNLARVDADLKALEPKERVQALTGLIPYVVPKMASVDASVAFDNLSDEQLDTIVESIVRESKMQKDE